MSAMQREGSLELEVPQLTTLHFSRSYYRLSSTTMGWIGLLSGVILLYSAFTPVASESQCALRPYGRPDPHDCAFLSVHSIPDQDVAEGFVLFSPPDPFIRLPIIWYFRQSSSFEHASGNYHLPMRQEHALFTSPLPICLPLIPPTYGSQPRRISMARSTRLLMIVWSMGNRGGRRIRADSASLPTTLVRITSMSFRDPNIDANTPQTYPTDPSRSRFTACPSTESSTTVWISETVVCSLVPRRNLGLSKPGLSSRDSANRRLAC